MKILHILFLTHLLVQPLLASHLEDNPMERYCKSLPLINLEDNLDLPQAILQYAQILGGGKPLEAMGQEKVLSQISQSIANDTPLNFVILGFPEKSSNTESKSISGQFDLADLLGLVTLEHLCQEIEKIYGRGAQVHIVCDEPYLNEMSQYMYEKVGVTMIPDKSTYHATLAKCLSSNHFTYISLADSLASDYHALNIVKNDKKPADGLIKFISKEIQTSELRAAKVTNKQRASLAKDMALIYERGVEKLRYLIDHHPQLGSMVRLSVHGDGHKLHMNLIHNSAGTPWHGVVEVDAFGHFTLTTTEQAKKSESLVQSFNFNGDSMAYVSHAN